MEKEELKQKDVYVDRDFLASFQENRKLDKFRKFIFEELNAIQISKAVAIWTGNLLLLLIYMLLREKLQ